MEPKPDSQQNASPNIKASAKTKPIKIAIFFRRVSFWAAVAFPLDWVLAYTVYWNWLFEFLFVLTGIAALSALTAAFIFAFQKDFAGTRKSIILLIAPTLYTLLILLPLLGVRKRIKEIQRNPQRTIERSAQPNLSLNLDAASTSWFHLHAS